MKNIFSTIQKKRVSLITGVLITTLITGISYAWLQQTQKDATTPQTAVEKERANSTDPTIENSKSQSGAVPPKTTTAPRVEEKKTPTPSSPTISPINVFISRVGVVKEHVELRSAVNGAATGKCSYIFGSIADGSVIKLSNELIPDATSSMCNIDVPLADFSIDGTWKASVTVESNGKNSNTSTESFEIKRR